MLFLLLGHDLFPSIAALPGQQDKRLPMRGLQQDWKASMMLLLLVITPGMPSLIVLTLAKVGSVDVGSHTSGPSSAILRRQTSIESYSSTATQLESSMRRLQSSMQRFQDIYAKYEAKQNDQKEPWQNVLQALERTTVVDTVDVATALQTTIDKVLTQRTFANDENISAEWASSFLKKLYPLLKFVVNVGGNVALAMAPLSPKLTNRLLSPPPKFQFLECKLRSW